MASTEQPPIKPKRRWRRLLQLAILGVLIGVIGVVGGGVWLQQSGYLARFVQDTIQRLSGQNITLDAITFPAWNAVAVTDIRVQKSLPGRQVEVICPRLEARFGLQSLLNKQAAALLVANPTIRVSPHDGSVPPPDASSPAASDAVVLPVNRIDIENGTVEAQEGDTTVVLQKINATLKPQSDQAIQMDVRAELGPDMAHIEATGQIGLDLSNPTGSWQVTVNSDALPQLMQTAAHVIPPDWTLTQGSLQATTDLALQDQTLQGTVRTQITQAHGQLAGLVLQDLSLTSEMTLEAQVKTHTLSLEGPLQIQAKRFAAPANVAATRLKLETPLRLAIAPDRWQVEVEPTLTSDRLTTDGAVQFQHVSSTGSLTAASLAQGWSLQGKVDITAPTATVGDGASRLQLSRVQGHLPLQMTFSPGKLKAALDVTLRSQTLTTGDNFRAERVATRFPLTLRSSKRDWQLQGTANLDAQTLKIGAQSASQTTVENVQSRLPIQLTSDALELKDAHLQAQNWRWPATDTTALQSPINLRTTGQFKLKQRQLHVQRADITLPELGLMQGTVIWQWVDQTVRDVNLEVKPVSVEALWNFLKPVLPAPYPDWLVDGQTRLQITVPRLAWKPDAVPSAWTLHWHLDNIAFSNPEGDRAGEHLSGVLKTTVSMETNPNRYVADGKLNLTPFALLIGNFFPPLEDRQISTAIDFTSAYYPDSTRLNLQLDGQLSHIGRISLQGTLQRPSTDWHYTLTSTLHQLNAQTLYQVFGTPPDSSDDTVSALTLNGTLTARLQAQGQNGSAHLQGDVDVNATRLQTGATELENLVLKLPLDLHYPLPQSRPNLAALPASAYGRLTIGRALIGGLQIRGIDTAVAVRSDSVLFPDDIDLSLLQGRVILQQFNAYHLLQDQRHIQLGLQLRALNLEDIQRSASNLPLAGWVDADFPRIAVKGQRLETDGDLTLRVAGGKIRMDNVTGDNVFTRFPTLRAGVRTEDPLSLRQLTQIYPIGGIGGTLHFTLDDLAVTALEPESFHLTFHVQEKRGEQRIITVRALNNLLFTTGSAKVDASQAYPLPYKRFGADITLKHDTLRLRGLYHDSKGREYFMRAPLLGGGVSIVNRVPKHGVAFRNFIQRLKATVLDKPAVSIKQ